MGQKDIKDILYRVSAGSATPEDEQIATYWLHYFRRKEIPNLTEDELTAESDAIYRSLMAGRELKPAKIIRLWPRIAAAASILLFLSVGAYFLLHKKQPALQVAQIHDIAPGGNKAILTLANGRKISVTDAAIGSLTQQAGNNIAKTADGQLVYTGVKANAKMVYDTLTIPRGGQYQLRLADGSKVWLNAASSIRYPENFAGTERKVELISGEAYFEVVHNARMPFRVVTHNQVVEDLGTHFNINAYADEPVMKTTLLEGSVRISSENKNTILIPGQQSQVAQGAGSKDISVVDDADMEEVIAWKNGLFKFHDANIQTVMRQLSRWYNVNIEYAGKIPVRTFSGEITRNVNASQVLEILSYFKVDFQIVQRANGKTILVTP